MSTTLKRPMFRMGGSANSKGTGITSGLDRPGYQEAGFVNPQELEQKMSELQRLQEQFGVSYVPPEPESKFGKSDYLRLAKLGADILGAEPSEGLQFLSKPVSEFLGGTASALEAKKQRAEDIKEKQRLAKAGLFETAYKDIAAAGELEKKIAGEKEIQTQRYDLEGKLRGILGDKEMDRLIKEYDLKAELEKIKSDYDKDDKTFLSGFELGELEKNMRIISDIDQALENPDLSAQEKRALELDKNVAIEKLKRLKESDPVVDAFLDSDVGTAYIFQVGEALQQTVNPATITSENPEGRFWKPSDDGYQKEVLRRVREGLGLTYAEGGRVGLQAGGMSQSAISSPAAMNNQQAKQQMESLGYNELRSRLPKEISNDVVQLLSVSPQALYDFAEIRTQEDVDNFNRKYSVSLTLPQEA